ncbi:MAG: hypothetical protein ACOX6U_00715 [Oscillospiraceae bacterium]|jgi:hypothetical protein
MKAIVIFMVLIFITLPSCSHESTLRESNSTSEDAYTEDLTGTELEEFYQSSTDATVPPIQVIVNHQEIKYTAVKSENVPKSTVENGTWFVQMARANLKERPVIARDDVITVTFPEACPESVSVTDHWLSYAPPVGISNLGSQRIPAEMQDMIEKNTTEYSLVNNSFHFSTGFFKYPNEIYLSSLKGVILRGIQLTCIIDEQPCEYYFIFHTDSYSP